MTNSHLPSLDQKIGIGATEFTRRQIQKRYDSERDDGFIKKKLEFGKQCITNYINNKENNMEISEADMANMELASILYFDCLPESHKIRQDYSEVEVTASLITARLIYFKGDDPDYAK